MVKLVRTREEFVVKKTIIKYDRESYLEAIEESMVRLVKFLEVFDRFLRK